MFAWQDFLSLAERLAQDADDDSALRTAIGRAYYAAYHAAADYVRASGILETRHTHALVWAALAGDPDDARADVGKWGEILRRRRVAADYRHPFPGDVREQAQTAIVEARDVIDTLRRLA